MARVNNLPKGSKNHKAKLNESVIPSIRTSINLGLKDKNIASLFGVSRKTIYNIRINKAWTHVE